MVSGSSLGDGAAARESEFARGRAELRPFQLAGNVTSHRLTEVQHFSSEGYKFYLRRLRDDDINVAVKLVRRWCPAGGCSRGGWRWRCCRR